MLSLDQQNIMWEHNILGDSNPDQLRDTVLFLLGIHVGLCTGDEHYNLHRDTESVPSQLLFKRNNKGVRCLVYTEDSTTKANDGGINSMRKEHKIVWVYPSSNKVCCPVCIIDKNMSLLPPVKVSSKPNFYLRNLSKLTPAQWYGEQVIGLNISRKTLGKLAENAKIEGFFHEPQFM